MESAHIGEKDRLALDWMESAVYRSNTIDSKKELDAPFYHTIYYM